MNKTLEDKAKDWWEAEIEEFKNSTAYEFTIAAFMAGYKERDSEVQELKDAVLNLGWIICRINNKLGHTEITQKLIKEQEPLIERLKKEREG